MTAEQPIAPSSRRAYVFQDWEANQPALKPRLVLAYFRLAQVAPRPLAKVIRLSYRIFADWILGIELEWQTKVGPGLELHHGSGLVVHPKAVLGSRVQLRHGVTIGHKRPGGPWPVIGDDVEFGAGAVVIGGVHVGDGAVIGANAVVVKDVPAGRTVAGNPARLLEPKASAPTPAP